MRLLLSGVAARLDFIALIFAIHVNLVISRRGTATPQLLVASQLKLQIHRAALHGLTPCHLSAHLGSPAATGKHGLNAAWARKARTPGSSRSKSEGQKVICNLVIHRAQVLALG
jgi:hypothetical protein